MTPFDYTRAATPADAIAHAATGARYLGGGTNLVNLMRENIERPTALVDVTGLSAEIEARDDGSILIGAAAKNTAVAAHPDVRRRFPLLSRAILTGASAQIRNMATVGGNILQRTRCLYFYDDAAHCNKRDPGSGCDAVEGFNRYSAILGASPACVATHPSDMCVALAALDAVVHLQGTAGARTIKLTDLHRLPGDRPDIETELKPGELITAIEIPALAFGPRSAYRKIRDRASYAFALVSVAAAIELDGGTVRDVRLALGGVAHKPWRATTAETALRGQPATEVSFRAVAEQELRAAKALRDNAFKIELAKRAIVATLVEAQPEGRAMSTATMKHGSAGDQGFDLHEVGRPVTRVDGPLKVMGRARFAAEVPFENLTYAALVYSSIARGTIAAIDTTEAEVAPGIVLVMTYKNAPRLADPPLLMSEPGAAAPSSLPIMQNASIHWNGQPVAVVLGETQEQADHAATLIRVTYETQPAALSFERQKSKARVPKDILHQPSEITIGNPEDALGKARYAVDQIYRTPRHSHSAIEIHAATVAWEGDTLVVHDASQMIHLTRSTVAKIFKLPEEKVRILSPFVGGGFGSKGVWSHQILAAAAAKLAQRPVRILLSREGVSRATGGRTLTEQRVALAADDDGPLGALIHTGTVGMTTHNYCPEQFSFPARLLYAAKNIHVKQEIVDLDMMPNTFMRAPGEAVGTFALECALDELAEKMGLDPIALRRRIEPEMNPIDGRPFSGRNMVEAYRAGAARFGWDRRSAKPGAHREGDWLIGMGVGTGTYPYYRMPGGVARIRLNAEGHAVIQMGSHEMGMGTATVQAQVAADRLGLPLENVRFEYGNSAMPSGTMAGGSSQTASIVATVGAAVEALFGEIVKLAGNASPLSGLGIGEIEAHGAGLRARGDPTRHETYAAILKRARRDQVEVEAAAPPPAEVGQFSMHSYAAQFAEVRVNAITGETRVARFLGSFDCGRILNPKTAASQFRGGIIMGIGLALTEATLFDERTGRIMNPSLAEYHVPVHMDVPEIDVIWTDIPDPNSPLGVRGIGEIGITGVGAAIANAVYNATGKRIRDLPITLDKLL